MIDVARLFAVNWRFSLVLGLAIVALILLRDIGRGMENVSTQIYKLHQAFDALRASVQNIEGHTDHIETDVGLIQDDVSAGRPDEEIEA